MQQFDITYGGKIEVHKTGEMFLIAEIKNRLQTHLTFYRNGKMILKSSLFAFMFWHRIKIKFQDLPYPINYFENDSLMQFTMRFDNHEIHTIHSPFKDQEYIVYLNEAEIAQITYPKFLIGGYDKFTMVSQSDDDTINL